MSAEDENHLFGTVEPTKGVWYPIETAPKDGTEILVWFDEAKRHFILWWFDGDWRFIGGTITPVIPPSLWMPLPEPPK